MTKHAHNRTVNHYFFANGNDTPGEIGLEFEVEARVEYNPDGVHKDFPRRLGKWWQAHQDGSLRGINCEYVLTRPIPRDELRGALEFLNRKVTESGVTINNSNRCSTHVHINALELTFTQVFSWLTTYMIVEDLLARYAGPDRVGNLFCLRMSDAEWLVDTVANAIRNGRYRLFNDDQMRYSGVNLRALGRYGSLEFRTGGPSNNFLDKEEWIGILLKIKDFALQFRNPIEIVMMFSQRGPARFLEDIFGPEVAPKLRLGNWEEALQNGMRLAQDIVFASNWSEDDSPQNTQFDVFFENAPDVQRDRQLIENENHQLMRANPVAPRPRAARRANVNALVGVVDNVALAEQHREALRRLQGNAPQWAIAPVLRNPFDDQAPAEQPPLQPVDEFFPEPDEEDDDF